MDGVADMQEAAHLRAVSVDRQIFAGQCLPDEAWNDHAVAIALARAYYVEEPSDDDWGLALRVQGVPERFPERLRNRVGPATHRGRPEHAVRVLGQRRPILLPVDLGRRGVQEPAIVPCGSREHVLGAVD